MKKLFFAFVLFAGLAMAQAPDCFMQFTNQTITGTTNYQDNRRNACTNWVMTYQVTGFTAISLQFESATGASSPGTFNVFSGTVISGVNPSTSVACSTVTNCTTVFTGQVGWYRMNLSSVTGSGTVSATLKGYIGFVPLGGNTGQPGGCPTATPCVVVGPEAQGAASATAPVQVAGNDGAAVRRIFTDSSGRVNVIGGALPGNPGLGAPVQVAGTDGTNVRTVRTDASGQAQVVGAAAEGAAVAGNPVQMGLSDGTNERRLNAAVADGDANLAQHAAETAQWVWNGASFDRARTAALATMPVATTTTAVNTIGAQIVERGARWVVNSHPATSAQATATIAAEANVRHVADCVTFAEASGGAVTAATHFLTLRDGAAGAGTVLIQWVAAIPVAAGTGIQGIAPATFCGLNLVGTTNTAMTFEFDAGVTNAIETVSISGFNVN